MGYSPLKGGKKNYANEEKICKFSLYSILKFNHKTVEGGWVRQQVTEIIEWILTGRCWKYGDSEYAL